MRRISAVLGVTAQQESEKDTLDHYVESEAAHDSGAELLFQLTKIVLGATIYHSSPAFLVAAASHLLT